MAPQPRAARRPLALLLAAALVLTGCGADPAGDPAGGAATAAAPDPGALVDGGVVDEAALPAYRESVEALDESAQQELADELSGELERELYDVSGLTDALGGQEAVDASIAETAGWIGGLVDATTAAQPQPLARTAPFASQPGAGGDRTNLGQGLFGGLLLAWVGADAAVRATNDGTVGEKTSGPLTIRATADQVELTTGGTFTDSSGVTTELRSRTTAAPCPLPDGSFTASATVEMAATVDGGRTGKRGTFDVSIAGTVGEKAELVGYDTEYRGQLAEFTASRGGYVELSGGWPREGGGAARLAVTRVGGAATQALADRAGAFATLITLLVSYKLADAAKAGWESGRCVALAPTVSAGPKELAPSTAVSITAAPRSKIDGGKVGGTVTAVLSAGEASVTPDSAPADATFTYTAPGARNRSGSVALESRSRRGVAKATLAFDTEQPAYTASGGTQVRFSGTVGSTTAPFEVQGTFPGGTAVFRFDGARADGGAVSVSGGGSGATVTGKGTYTLSDQGGGVLRLDVRERSCVDVSGVCRTNRHRITLTPQA